jgi:hypothetical protein
MAACTARRVLLLGILTLAGLALHPSSGFAVTPCATADASCVVTPSTHEAQWTTVPPRINFAGQASSVIICPSGSVVAGADWTGPAGNVLSVDLNLLEDVWPSFLATFDAENTSTQPSSFAGFVGCVPRPATASGAPAVKHRVKTLRVRPGTRLTASSRCREGERQLHGGAAVLFDSRPTRAELRDHDYRYSVGARRVRVRLMAGRSVGDDERVTLQVHSTCR